MDQIFTYSKDIRYQILDYLNHPDLFNLASTSKELRRMVEDYYELCKKYFIVPISVSIGDLLSCFRVTLILDEGLYKISFDLSKDKNKRQKAKNYCGASLRINCRDRIILPTFRPLVDEVIRYYLRCWSLFINDY